MEKIENEVTKILELLAKQGREQIKAIYLRHGAKEPLFGVTTGSLKSMIKKMKKDYELSMALYRTKNYDAMYLARLLAEPKKMTKQDFEEWVQYAYCNAIADFIVAPVLAESKLAQEIADEWIDSCHPLYASAAWTCYAILLSKEDDAYFSQDKMHQYLSKIRDEIHDSHNDVRYAMNQFMIAVAVSYMPLHEEAMRIADTVGKVEVDMGDTSCKVPLASVYIKKTIDKKGVGKRKKRC